MKIKKVSVVDQVSEALKDNILNHTWEPGDKLPSEGDLADTFGVNRLSVRMALQKLNTLGLLETRVGDGTYVRKFSMAPYMNEIADIYMDEKHLNDVRELRNLLEGEAMRIAVSSSTEEEREELRQCYEQYEEKRSQLKEDVDNERLMDELAEAEIATGHMIVYTSADSVLQICGNEETFGLDELYRCCEIARELTMKDEGRVGRIIARPYVGKKKGEFKRTSNRHDYALKPTGKTALDALKENGYEIISVGKIRDIFDGEGITKAYKSKSSVHGMEQTVDIIRDEEFEGLCFVNLVDFDALWGHRRNPEGYAREVEMFDVKLGEALADLREDDLLMITADHGNDPTYSGTDHTREQVPLLIYSKKFEGAGRLEETDTFAAVGATIAENFGVKMPEGTIGRSMLGTLV